MLSISTHSKDAIMKQKMDLLCKYLESVDPKGHILIKLKQKIYKDHLLFSIMVFLVQVKMYYAKAKIVLPSS